MTLYEDLQERLDDLRKRIAEKREEAIKLFEALLQEMLQDKNLPEALKEQLREIKAALNLVKKPAKKEENIAELTTEDILKAMQSLMTSADNKAQISTQLLRKELREVVAMRLSQQQNLLPDQLRNVATAEDYINLLNSKSFKAASDKAGGADKLLGDTIKLAETTSQIANSLSSMKESLGKGTLPQGLGSDKGVER
jgi:hypothetical protein